MKYIIILSTHWGYQEGGINSFNYDFTMALGPVAKQAGFSVICITLFDTTDQRAKDARQNDIQLFSLNKTQNTFAIDQDLRSIKSIVQKLEEPSFFCFVGHDVFTGEIANYLAQEYPDLSLSVVFHHMDYEAYYNMKGDSSPADLREKFAGQNNVLTKASLVLAIGPLLLSSARQKVRTPAAMIIPGMQDIDAWEHKAKSLNAVTFGRYDARTDRLKQMALAAAAFSVFAKSRQSGASAAGTLKIIGIDKKEDAIDLLKKTQDSQKDEYINILPLPYTSNRHALMTELSQANVSLMLSVHDGFGLVGLEAIAAGTPLILSQNCGLYEFLVANLNGEPLKNYGVCPVVIRGSSSGNINKEDVDTVVKAIENVKELEGIYQDGILKLRTLLKAKYTWQITASDFIKKIEAAAGSRLNTPEKKKQAPGKPG